MLKEKPLLGPKVGSPPKSAVALAASRWHVEEKSALAVRCASDKVFPGQYYDQETGLYYNYMRDYSSEIGRYIESDLIGLNGGLNTYLYANIISDYEPTMSSATLPKTHDCKIEEWQECERRCPHGADGCYVTVSWKIKAVKGKGPIRVEGRTVNCNCREPACSGNVKPEPLPYWIIIILILLPPTGVPG